MHRFGIVSEVSAATGEVRVVFDAHDNLASALIPVVQPFTLGNRAYRLPDLRSQVLCALDEDGEAIAVLGAVYSEADPPPVASADKVHVVFTDGTSVEYDRAAHQLVVTVKGGDVTVNVDAAKKVHVGGPGGQELATKQFVQQHYNAHTHPTPTGVSGPPITPAPLTPGADITKKQLSE